MSTEAVARAALAEAAQAPKGWQPIESAPKDGSLILVIDDGALTPMPGIAHWGDGSWRAGNASEWLSKHWAEDESPEECLGYYPTATRWRTIPAAPQPESQQCQARATGATE